MRVSAIFGPSQYSTDDFNDDWALLSVFSLYGQSGSNPRGMRVATTAALENFISTEMKSTFRVTRTMTTIALHSLKDSAALPVRPRPTDSSRSTPIEGNEIGGDRLKFLQAHKIFDGGAFVDHGAVARQRPDAAFV